MSLIIGITGTLGAGKGTIVDYLVRTHDFVHFSVRGFITKEIEKRGLAVNRDSMVLVANDLRAKHSPSYLAEQLFQEAKKTGKNCIIESLRTEGEVQELKQKGEFYLFAIDAEPKTRYERIVKRANESDSVSFEKFKEQEKTESTSNDPNKQNLNRCIELADFKFENNGTFEKLYKQVEDVLNEIEKK